MVVGLDLGFRDRLNLILDRIDRLLHFGDLLSLRHPGWLFFLGPQLPVRFGKLSELSNGGLGTVETPCGSKSNLGGETRRVREIVSTERTVNRMPRPCCERLMNGENTLDLARCVSLWKEAGVGVTPVRGGRSG